MQGPNIGFTLPEYEDNLSKWRLISDCLEGEETLKGSTTDYLPMPNPEDMSVENVKRYENYVQRAVFYNVTKRTLNGLVGQVFTKEPEVDLPEALKLLEEDVDGSNVSLVQQSRKTLKEILSKGRAGLFVDYPKTENSITREQELKGIIVPTIINYTAEQIINWRTKKTGAKKILSLVVINEFVNQESKDGFELENVEQWKVLKLNEAGVYVIEHWQYDEKLKEYFRSEEDVFPTDSSGKNLEYIPFAFVGVENNDDKIDPAPLYDISNLNVAHFRNSADYEESVFLVGQPTPIFTGLTEHWVTEVLKGEIHLGSRASVPLPENASGTLLQAQPNTLVFEAMEHKEKQMVALGAKLIERKEVQRTATEARNDNTSEMSVLIMAANNVSSAYLQALAFALEFTSGKGSEAEIIFQLNTEYSTLTLSSEEQKQLIELWQSGAIVVEELRQKLKHANVATLELEEYKVLVEQEIGKLPSENQGE